MFSSLYLPLALFLPLSYSVFDELLLLVHLVLYLREMMIDPVDVGLKCSELRVDSVAEGALQLIEVVEDVVLHYFVGLYSPLGLSLEYVLEGLEGVLDFCETTT